MFNFYSILRPLLFSLQPELAHKLSLTALSYVPKACFKVVSEKPIQAMGLSFKHPVGLAAGLDKNGSHVDALGKLGFSFIEIGTVTPKPQLGNAQPRLFRIPQAKAIINRMGFNNDGVEQLIHQIKNIRYSGILGINIGKNKETSLAQAASDYLYCLNQAYPYASYITINISSPNTPDLRQLQSEGYFLNLLQTLKIEQKKLADHYQRHVPLVIKVSPDENDETLKNMAEIVLRQGAEGIIATNTSASRCGVKGFPNAHEAGGLSGKPIQALSLHCLKLLKQYVGDAVTLIGVGGIDDCASAQAKLNAGATLVQLYSGLIYQGPQIVSAIANELKVKEE